MNWQGSQCWFTCLLNNGRKHIDNGPEDSIEAMYHGIDAIIQDKKKDGGYGEMLLPYGLCHGERTGIQLCRDLCRETSQTEVVMQCGNGVRAFQLSPHRPASIYADYSGEPANSMLELVRFATIGLKKIFKKAVTRKKAGVIVMDFTPEAAMQTLENINKAVVRAKIKLASQDPDRTWKMRQEKLSPLFHTDS